MKLYSCNGLLFTIIDENYDYVYLKEVESGKKVRVTLQAFEAYYKRVGGGNDVQKGN